MPKNNPSVLLRRVEIENFKSVKKDEIDLKPLTAVVGVNSSGKSTFIQAVLLLIQHIRDEYASDLRYSLNDDLVRLGSYAETARQSEGTSSDFIRIALELSPRRGFLHLPSSAQASLLWDVTLTSDENPNSKFARMSSLHVSQEVQGLSDASSLTEIQIDHVGDLESNATLANVLSAVDRSYLRPVASRVTSQEATEQLDFMLFVPGQLPEAVRLTALSDLIISMVVERLRMSFRNIGRWIAWSGEDSESALGGLLKNRSETSAQLETRNKTNLATIRSSMEVMRLPLRNLVTSEKYAGLFDVGSDGTQKFIDAAKDELTGDFLNDVRKLVFESTRNASLDFTTEESSSPMGIRLPPESNELMRSTLLDALGTVDPMVLVASDQDRGPRRLLRSTIRTVLSSIHYLGPIRDIDLEVSGARTRRSVGRRGEYCADVLQREASERIPNAPLPVGNTSVRDSSPFIDILSSWLQFLELAEGVEVEDHGRYKAGIKVRPLRGEGMSVAVSSVGVGVAQVLPIIVQCLLADPGRSLVVIEQPELHLHPSLEVKLADFFVACARSGRQIFIETHSEHLINRLRLAIAQDDSGDTRDLVSVLFAQQDQRTGITEYRNAVINELGGIEGDGWPPNFIDLSTDQGLALLKEAVARRQRMAPANQIDDDDF